MVLGRYESRVFRVLWCEYSRAFSDSSISRTADCRRLTLLDIRVHHAVRTLRFRHFFPFSYPLGFARDFSYCSTTQAFL